MKKKTENTAPKKSAKTTKKINKVSKVKKVKVAESTNETKVYAVTTPASANDVSEQPTTISTTTSSESINLVISSDLSAPSDIEITQDSAYITKETVSEVLSEQQTTQQYDPMVPAKPDNILFYIIVAFSAIVLLTMMFL
jgi:hypothetical protein